MFVLGKGIKGGLYGDHPDLASLDDGDLRRGIDFRSVDATLIEDWLGAPSRDVLGGRYERLGFVAWRPGRPGHRAEPRWRAGRQDGQGKTAVGSLFQQTRRLALGRAAGGRRPGLVRQGDWRSNVLHHPD